MFAPRRSQPTKGESFQGCPAPLAFKPPRKAHASALAAVRRERVRTRHGTSFRRPRGRGIWRHRRLERALWRPSRGSLPAGSKVCPARPRPGMRLRPLSPAPVHLRLWSLASLILVCPSGPPPEPSRSLTRQRQRRPLETRKRAWLGQPTKELRPWPNRRARCLPPLRWLWRPCSPLVRRRPAPSSLPPRSGSR